MPPRRSQVDVAKPSFDDMVAGAFARNGLNTLLLDIKEDLGGVVKALTHIEAEQKQAQISRRSLHEKLDQQGRQLLGLKQTVDVIAPKVMVLDTERSEKIGSRRILTRGRVVVGSVVTSIGGAGGLWHYWDVVRSWASGSPPHMP